MDGDNDQNKNSLKPEEKMGEIPKEFGNVVDALHNKSKLPSLRTYQGDMAEYIKEKDQSVVSVALKEKERKEKREEAEGKVYQTPKPSKDNIQTNLTIIITSIILIFGAIAVSAYVYRGLKEKSTSNNIVAESGLIPYNNVISLSNITKENIGTEISKTENPGGINIFKILDANSIEIKKAQNFFNLINISLPGTLERTLKDDYVLGSLFANQQTTHFLIISVSDFGVAFSGMLEWEVSIDNDLAWLNTAQINLDQDNNFVWKDLIVKNKDIRALVNEENYSSLAYTFLDKNTILITNNISSIGDITSAYASRTVAR